MSEIHDKHTTSAVPPRKAYEIELIPLGNDDELLGAIEIRQREGQRWEEAKSEEERHAILRHWNRIKLLCLDASIAGTKAHTITAVRAKADFALRTWRRSAAHTPDDLARINSVALTALEDALSLIDALKEIAQIAQHELAMEESEPVKAAIALADGRMAEVEANKLGDADGVFAERSDRLTTAVVGVGRVPVMSLKDARGLAACILREYVRVRGVVPDENSDGHGDGEIAACYLLRQLAGDETACGGSV